MTSQSSLHCGQCGRTTIHERQELGADAACILAVLTGGIFLLLWLIIAASPAPWTCQVCGVQSDAPQPPSGGSILLGALVIAFVLALVIGFVVVCVKASP